jgi:site-specific DNA-methyltransferase (adenine-specific)
MLESGFYLMDCMDGMAQFPDKFFELAIVDPPYGININMNQGRRKGDIIKHAKKEWDKDAPTHLFWDELTRVSVNQVVWGANNFAWLPPHNGWVVWDKDITGDVPFSKAELAYNSIINAVDMVKIRAQTGEETYANKIHPTQKPIALYKWLLTNYAKPGDKMLDTHVGSASSLVACHQMGFQYWGFELDPDYFKAATERLEKAKAQVSLFDNVPQLKAEQVGF